LQLATIPKGRKYTTGPTAAPRHPDRMQLTLQRRVSRNKRGFCVVYIGERRRAKPLLHQRHGGPRPTHHAGGRDTSGRGNQRSRFRVGIPLHAAASHGSLSTWWRRIRQDAWLIKGNGRFRQYRDCRLERRQCAANSPELPQNSIRINYCQNTPCRKPQFASHRRCSLFHPLTARMTIGGGIFR
jgi:hypothetical protein